MLQRFVNVIGEEERNKLTEREKDIFLLATWLAYNVAADIEEFKSLLQ